MKTTAPKKYCVKPNTGFVGKGQTVNVHVIMQAQREWPQDMMKCKDKFLVQSCPSGGITEFTELFVKGKEDIKEQKLKVSYSQPAPPPSDARLPDRPRRAPGKVHHEGAQVLRPVTLPPDRASHP